MINLIMDSPHKVKVGQAQKFITVKGLCKSFAGQPIYQNLNLELPNNQLVSIFGPNGCGKSTLINMMSGLSPMDKGEIKIHDKPIHRARIGYVFQNYRDSLFPWMSAYDNIAYPLRVKGHVCKWTGSAGYTRFCPGHNYERHITRRRQKQKDRLNALYHFFLLFLIRSAKVSLCIIFARHEKFFASHHCTPGQ